MKVARSTVYREIRRNSELKGYHQKKAHNKAKKRAVKARQRAYKMILKLRNLVIKKLEFGLSPVQISGWLKLRREINISHV